MTLRKSRRGTGLLIGAATALVLTGCGAGNGGGSTAGSGRDPALPAVSVSPGVTTDKIKIGIVYPDLSAVKHVLNVDNGDYEATYNALIGQINDAGGINGREIEPVFGKINVASPVAAQETCVKLTQDEQVFAVIGTMNGYEPMCYAQTNKTAVVGGPLTMTSYAQAQAPWFSYDRGGDEVGEGVEQLRGSLVGKKVAVVGVVNEEAMVRETVLPALQNIGVTPVGTEILKADFRDPAAVAQQTGLFVQKFKSAGADTVIVVGGMGSEFPKQLEKAANYRPRLVFTNTSTVGSYLQDETKHDFSTLNNAVALSPKSQWDEPSMQDCAKTVELDIPALRGKLTVDRQALAPGSPTPQVSLEYACRTLALFTDIADKAGADLNYDTFQNAGLSLGTVRLPGFAERALYSPGSPNGGIPVHVYQYDRTTQKFLLPSS